MRKKLFIGLSLLVILATSGYSQVMPTKYIKEKTAFQTSSPWIPQIDVRSDVAIVYGAGDRPDMTFEQRVQSWRDHGYQTSFMTGIAWGQYEDYFLGQWDGKNHLSEGQVTRAGDTIWHGRNIPYIVPTASFIHYMEQKVAKRVIDAGIHTIFFEEPEFWARAGYSEAFKAEWQNYYHFPWRPQHESPENTYLANKLKYHLYYNAIKEVSSFCKEYGKSKGVDVKVYIATHSLVNYSSWMIVSPEASLASLPGIDGYIAQVWTGTSREPTYFKGKEKERVFENAFLEYGSMTSMTAPTGRKMYFLTDPIEDWPRDWGDYKRNYEATFTAEILYPMVNRYEVMPWPERIYTKPYKTLDKKQEVLIPRYYSTQMQVMINALNNMPLSKNQVSGINTIGVLMGNSLMFQRYPTHNGFEDPRFSNFYGQTMPLLKRGIPVQTVHMENLSYKQTLKNIKILVVSYSNMKPLSPDVHQYLSDWVREGGVLVYCGKDDDPYQSVMEWWNTGENHFKTPVEHLWSLLKINPDDSDQRFQVGQGVVYVLRQNPKSYVMSSGNSEDVFLKTIKQAYENDTKSGKLAFKNNFYLQRGPYDIVSVMDESVSSKPYEVKGPVIDLFDPELPVLSKKIVIPGRQALLYCLDRLKNRQKPQVLASAARIYDEAITVNSYSMVAKSPLSTTNSMRIFLPAAPKVIHVTDHKGQIITQFTKSWDAISGTCHLGFENDPEGIHVEILW